MRVNGRSGWNPRRERSCVTSDSRSGTSITSGPGIAAIAVRSRSRAVLVSRATIGPRCVAVRPGRASRKPPVPGSRRDIAPGRPRRSARISDRSAPKASLSSSATSGKPGSSAGSVRPLPPPRQRVSGSIGRNPIRSYTGRPTGVASRKGTRPRSCQRRDRALEESRSEAAPPVGAVHQDHADPAEIRRVRERQGGRDEAPAVPGNRERPAEADHHRPVLGRLVPARFLGQCESCGNVGRAHLDDRRAGERLTLSTCHPCPRSPWACRGSACLGRPSPPPSRSSSRALPSGSRRARTLGQRC